MTRLEEIEQRAAAATPGPWDNRGRYMLSFVWEKGRKSDGLNVPPGSCHLCLNEDGVFIDTVIWPGNGKPYHLHYFPTIDARESRSWRNIVSGTDGTEITGMYDYEDGGVGTLQDSEFIAHAREDVPFLLERLRAAMRVLHENHNSLVDIDGCSTCWVWLGAR